VNLLLRSTTKDHCVISDISDPVKWFNSNESCFSIVVVLGQLGNHIYKYFMVLLRTAGAAGLLGILYTTIRSTNPAFLGTLSNNITRSMSTQAGKEGITAWADKDGSFKRQVSSFRDRIEEGGKFAPEKGKLIHV
jgi:hypothetical protein